MKEETKKILIGVVAGGLVATVFYAIGGTVDPYVAGLNAPIMSAIGFVGGFATAYLK